MSTELKTEPPVRFKFRARVDERGRRVQQHILISETMPKDFEAFHGTRTILRAREEDGQGEESLFTFPIKAITFEEAFERFDPTFEEKLAISIQQGKEAVAEFEKYYAGLSPEEQKAAEDRRISLLFIADIENEGYADSQGRQIHHRYAKKPTKIKFKVFEGAKPYIFPLALGQNHEELLHFEIKAETITEAFDNFDAAYEARAKERTDFITQLQAVHAEEAYQQAVKRDVAELQRHKKLIMPPKGFKVKR